MATRMRPIQVHEYVIRPHANKAWHVTAQLPQLRLSLTQLRTSNPSVSEQDVLTTFLCCKPVRLTSQKQGLHPTKARSKVNR
ncbi:hypothetical protein ALO45_200152 [Pseudomonas syringae pv. syringae]|nr:hypothetical protein ALO45_200152 [Pseudomonas syringae pv. syringae]